MKSLMAFLFLLPMLVGAQVNLVPNPSFEEHTICPHNTGWIWAAPPWAGGGCDYFHECGTNSFSVPINRYGNEYARTGQAYSQVSCWAIIVNNFREYLRVELTDTLMAGARYNVEFYISMKDSQYYSVRNIGLHLSVVEQPTNIDSLLALDPQVKYAGADFLMEKVGWTNISGTYIAEGGEKFIVIGNFDDDSETDTLFIPGGGNTVGHPYGYWEFAGYYIDDVSIMLDTSVGINEFEIEEVNLYPNPNNGNMHLEYSGLTDDAFFEIYDVMGRRVATYQLPVGAGKLNINEERLESGLYTYRITNKHGVYKAGKVVVSR